MDAIGYCRVSTDEQGFGVSMDAQRAKIIDWCALNQHNLVDVLADEVSGKWIRNRPGILKALDLVTARKGVLVVYSLTRLSRCVGDTIAIAERLNKAGAQMASWSERIDTTSAAGRVFFVVIAAFAAYERELIVERTRFALDHKRQRGEALGNAPYGFENDTRYGRRKLRHEPAGKLAPVEAERDGLRTLLALAGGLPAEAYAQIARAANGAGVRTRSGKPWGRGTARKVIRFYDSPAGRALLARFPLDIGGQAILPPARGNGAAGEKA